MPTNLSDHARDFGQYSADIAIVGAGPAGLTLAGLLLAQSFKVMVLERQDHFGFKIGESLLPQSLKIWQKMGFLETLAQAGFVRKNGAILHSENLQRSMRVDFSQCFDDSVTHAYQVERHRFDCKLCDFVAAKGGVVHMGEDVVSVEESPQGLIINDRYQVRLLVWANGLSHRQHYPHRYLSQDTGRGLCALFRPFEVEDYAGLQGDILVDIFHLPDLNQPCWAWAIPIAENRLSVGYVLPQSVLAEMKRLKKTTNDEIFTELQKQTPFLSDRLSGPAKGAVMMRHDYERVARQVAFGRQFLLGDAAGFIDPVFSSGVHLGVFAADALATLLATERNLIRDGASVSENLREAYSQQFFRHFATYYYFVRLFYDRHIVEKLFLVAPSLVGSFYQQKVREFASILSGDLDSPNPMLANLTAWRGLNISSSLRQHLEHYAATT